MTETFNIAFKTEMSEFLNFAQCDLQEYELFCKVKFFA